MMKRSLLYVLSLLLFASAIAAQTCFAEITVDANFPGGNAVVDSIADGVVRLRPDLRDTEGDWFYTAFRVRGAAGQTLTFEYDADNRLGPRGQAVSEDGGKTWSWTSDKLTTESRRFSYTFGPDANDVLFATSPLYTRANWDAFVKKYAGKPGFEPGVLCQARDGSDARMLAIRPTSGAKFAVVLTARHHACEAVASYVLEGLIDAIEADDANGEFLRANCEFFVVPMIDEPGVEAGDQGKNRRPHDHNRDYATAIYPTIKALETYVTDKFAEKKLVFMDWHCPWIRGGAYNERIYSPETADERMTAQLRRYSRYLEQEQSGKTLPYAASNNLEFGKEWNTSANYARSTEGGETLSSKHWAERLPNIWFSCSFEIPYANVDGAVVTTDAAREFGRSAAAALAKTLADPKSSDAEEAQARPSFGGIYPHLAYFNNENECGTGAVVPWADRLWAITYGPHLPNGSSDKLYEIDDALNVTIRLESVGGTNANRMIHRESNQLFIGNHVIDAERNVRTIPHSKMFGRHTATTRHTTDPEHKVFDLTMEEGLYEIDADTLEVREICKDGNKARKPEEDVLPGYHGKGGYMTQGRVVYTNNGENSDQARVDPATPSGCLGEWFGEDKGWNVARRNQFTEATGPDGIYGGSGDDVLWTLGWDVKSVILMTLKDGKWTTFRLPKASHCYDGAHGWNTEWPRIRKIDDEDRYLATMHGQFWRFPKSFDADAPRGIRPRSTYLKVIGDWAYWNNRVVFGCDDSAKSEFLNKSPFKSGTSGPGQSNSNLWFVEPERLDTLGTSIGRGALWLNEEVEADAVSDPYLIGGYDRINVYYSFDAENAADVKLTFEVSRGDGNWSEYQGAANASNGVFSIEQPQDGDYEWVRVRSNAALHNATCFIHSRQNAQERKGTGIFNGLASPENCGDFLGARLWTRGDNQRLAVVSQIVQDGKVAEERYYELTKDARLERVECKFEGGEPGTISRVKAMIEPKEVDPSVCAIDELSVLVNYGGKRWRLPIGSQAVCDAKTPLVSRLDREVCTERDLFHCAGTFYELPAENAGGFPKIRPIATSGALIVDYASYRGMLVLSGVSADASGDSDRIVRSEDGKCALWLGAVDDLWELGSPRGSGGVWKDQDVTPGMTSDPMLATGFDRKTLTIENNSDSAIELAIEFDPTCEGKWAEYKKVVVPANGKIEETLDDVPAYWIRVAAYGNANVSARFDFGDNVGK